MNCVGPIEAAVELTAALAALDQHERLSHLMVSLGLAGSRVVEQTAIYQATSVSYRDMDASPLSFEKGATPSPRPFSTCRRPVPCRYKRPVRKGIRRMSRIIPARSPPLPADFVALHKNSC